jgi:hypothetical protein
MPRNGAIIFADLIGKLDEHIAGWSALRLGVGGLCITQVLEVASHLKAGHELGVRGRESLRLHATDAIGCREIRPVRLRRGSLRLDPSLGRCRLQRHGSDAPRRQLDKTRCRVQKRPQWQ